MNKDSIHINKEYNEEITDFMDDDGYESNDEIKIEVTDYVNGNPCTQIYTVPYRPTHCNEKRLICFSKINNQKCIYGSNCTYAHNLEEQVIDDEKKFIYQIVLDRNLMNFFSITNPKTSDIYKYLLFLTNICNNCINKKCTGGYNCRNGVCDTTLKLCKNDLLTGECLNKLIDIPINELIINKLKTNDFEGCDTYKGCINGHHLTTRNLMPYYKYVHQKENSKKNKYQSIRYIDIDPISRVLKNYNNNYYEYGSKINRNDSDNDSDSETDEEINGWFKNKNNSDDEWNNNNYPM